MYEIVIEDSFDAAHCLREYNGNCRRLHGHTYKVKVAFRFKNLDSSGMALDFRAAKNTLKEILDYLDHKYLNELDEFTKYNPTAENLSHFIYEKIKSVHSEAYSVSLWETPTSCATYWED